MHTEAFELVVYPLMFVLGANICYLMFRINPNLGYATNQVPKMFLAMMMLSLLGTASLDLIFLALVSFDFNLLHFIGPAAYPDFMERPLAVTLHVTVAIVSLWFGMRWISNRQSKFSSPKSPKMEY